MKAQVLTTTRSASSAAPAGGHAVGQERADELVGVDLVLRAAEGLDEERAAAPGHGARVLVRPFATRTLARRGERPASVSPPHGTTGVDDDRGSADDRGRRRRFVTEALRAGGVLGSGTTRRRGRARHHRRGRRDRRPARPAPAPLRRPGGRRARHRDPQDPVAVPREPGRRRPLQLLRAGGPLLRAARRQGAGAHRRLLLEPHRHRRPAPSGCSSRTSATAR